MTYDLPLRDALRGACAAVFAFAGALRAAMFSAAVRTNTRLPSNTAAIRWIGDAPRARSSAA